MNTADHAGRENICCISFGGREQSSAADRVVVRLSGEITAKNAGRIGRRLQQTLRSQPRVLEIDLGNVTYLSNDGGAVFFTVLRAARPQGTRVIATHVRAQPLGSLNQLGLFRVLDVYEGNGPLGSGRGGQ
ncbi:STAS domain-containing protein [Streptomyces sp. NPDC093591]|uniref:STAS domain-containing protein n=1 Tax=Streptomyces sp. NPDC093591 TaxID=3366044 RepID=UPI0038282EE9